jgi:hypothetical protein
VRRQFRPAGYTVDVALRTNQEFYTAQESFGGHQAERARAARLAGVPHGGRLVLMPITRRG